LAFLVVKRGDTEDVGRTFELTGDSVIVGRRSLQQQPEIDLSDEVVSRRHLEIVRRGVKFMVKDLDSTNGTMLDDDRILPGKYYELKHNSKIGLGLEGDSARVILLFKESESTNIIARKNASASAAFEKSVITWLKIDERKKEVWVDEKQQKLSKKEYELILFLFNNAGKICSRDEIIGAVWPESKDPSAISDATIDQLVHRLREKVEPEVSRPTRIVSKKAFGYMMM
jgi:pSer/pThr/pTyr-binding forkhead associated (FHA) protein